MRAQNWGSSRRLQKPQERQSGRCTDTEKLRMGCRMVCPNSPRGGERCRIPSCTSGISVRFARAGMTDCRRRRTAPLFRTTETAERWMVLKQWTTACSRWAGARKSAGGQGRPPKRRTTVCSALAGTGERPCRESPARLLRGLPCCRACSGRSRPLAGDRGVPSDPRCSRT